MSWIFAVLSWCGRKSLTNSWKVTSVTSVWCRSMVFSASDSSLGFWAMITLSTNHALPIAFGFSTINWPPFSPPEITAYFLFIIVSTG